MVWRANPAYKDAIGIQTAKGKLHNIHIMWKLKSSQEALRFYLKKTLKNISFDCAKCVNSQ